MLPAADNHAEEWYFAGIYKTHLHYTNVTTFLNCTMHLPLPKQTICTNPVAYYSNSGGPLACHDGHDQYQLVGLVNGGILVICKNKNDNVACGWLCLRLIIMLKNGILPVSIKHTCTTPTSQHFLTAPCTYPYQSKSRRLLRRQWRASSLPQWLRSVPACQFSKCRRYKGVHTLKHYQ